MATKTYISDQVLYRLAGGYPPANFPVQPEDVWAALGQKVNAKYKVEQFNVDMANGETVPNGACVAYYEEVAVASSVTLSNSLSILPVLPISLPRNMGVVEISDPKGQVSFIPLIAGQRQLLKSQPLINDLLGQVGYEQRGKTITYTRDLTLLGISTVNMSLAVMDISTYSETDNLPIPADHLDGIVNELVIQFSQTGQKTGEVNNYANT